jgi:hypothetical protein
VRQLVQGAAATLAGFLLGRELPLQLWALKERASVGGGEYATLYFLMHLLCPPTIIVPWSLGVGGGYYLERDLHAAAVMNGALYGVLAMLYFLAWCKFLPMRKLSVFLLLALVGWGGLLLFLHFLAW